MTATKTICACGAPALRGSEPPICAECVSAAMDGRKVPTHGSKPASEPSRAVIGLPPGFEHEPVQLYDGMTAEEYAYYCQHLLPLSFQMVKAVLKDKYSSINGQPRRIVGEMVEVICRR